MSSKYLVQVVEKVTDGQKNIVQKILVFSLSEAQRFKKIYSERYPDFVIETKQKYKDGWKIVQI